MTARATTLTLLCILAVLTLLGGAQGAALALAVAALVTACVWPVPAPDREQRR